jgi:hypothetical protein
MAFAISGATHANPSAASAAPSQAPAPSPAPSKKATSPPPMPQDSVHISNAAKAALQELTETRFQTAQEASRGDLQVRRLLAKEKRPCTKIKVRVPRVRWCVPGRSSGSVITVSVRDR